MKTKALHTVKMTALASMALIAGSLSTSSVYADTTYYKLHNYGSGMVADVMWASTDLFQGVFLWPLNNSFSQEFEKLDSGNGYFRLRARHSGQCLMLDWRNNWVNGTPVVQFPHCGAGYAAAEWTIRWVYTSRGPNGYPQSVQTLVNRATGKCLDVRNPKGSYPPVQSVLQQWDCISTVEDWNAHNQSWYMLDAHPVYTPPR